MLTGDWCVWTAQSEEDAIKDELAQEYRALQNQTSKRPTQQNQQQQQVQQPKKSSGIGKLFGRLVLVEMLKSLISRLKQFMNCSLGFVCFV